MAAIAPRSPLAVAALVLVHASIILGALGFLFGLTGGVLAVIAVHTGRDQQVDLRVYPVELRTRRPSDTSLLQLRETQLNRSSFGLPTQA